MNGAHVILSEAQGRRLILTVATDEGDEPVEPFVVRPVSYRVGRVLTGHYLNIIMNGQANGLPNAQAETLLAIALDGGVFREADDVGPARIELVDGDDGPLRPLYDRAVEELSVNEETELCWKAFLWQSILGMEGIAEFDKADNPVMGMAKTMGLLMSRLGVVPRMSNPTQPVEPPVNSSNTGDGSEPSLPPRKPTDHQKPKKPPKKAQ